MTDAVSNGKVQTKCTKAMDMRFHWQRDCKRQQQFQIYLRPGKLNYAEYWTKHHLESHHCNMRKEFLTPLRSEYLPNGSVQWLPAKPWIFSIGRCCMNCSNEFSWSSKWPAMEVHLFVIAAFFVWLTIAKKHSYSQYKLMACNIIAHYCVID